MSESDIRADEAEDPWAPEDDQPGLDAGVVPEADAREQRQSVVGWAAGEPTPIPFDVDPADAAEQQRVVEYDEDDYR